jgi:hypothetical protein
MTDPASRLTGPESRRGRVRGADRLTVALFSGAAFLAVLALLATQVGGQAHAGRTAVRPREILVRRVYRTRVVTRILPAGSGGRSGETVSQSVSGSPSIPSSTVPAPVTRAS